jgi:membrane protease YdiL (CAAX protease family)
MEADNMNNLHLGWLERAQVLSENRLVITVELLVAVILQALQACRIISGAIVYLFLLGSLSLWLRQSGWRQIGLRRPDGWQRTIGLGLILGLAYQVVSILLVVPILRTITHEPLDLSRVTSVYNNFPLLILWLAVTWTLAAFGEEMVYRGYLLNRVADLLGRRPAGWIVALIVASLLFGFGHAYQGITGIVETFLFGGVMAGLYFAGHRNVWLPVVAHGAYDTLAFLWIFLGLYR